MAIDNGVFNRNRVKMTILGDVDIYTTGRTPTQEVLFVQRELALGVFLRPIEGIKRADVLAVLSQEGDIVQVSETRHPFGGVTDMLVIRQRNQAGK
jgi:hypothetical protein